MPGTRGPLDAGSDHAESRQLVARVETVPLAAVPEALRADEIRLAVHPGAEGLEPADYLKAAAAPPPGRDLVAVVSLGIIDSPDEVEVHEARLEDRRLFLLVHVRDFEGRLAANVLRLALAIIDLGDLSPGRYEATVQVDRYPFTEYEHPETATFDASSSHRLQFEVAEDGAD